MSHDKIKAAARKRMAETGEPYSVARREILKARPTAEPAPEPAPASVAAGAPPARSPWFAIDYSDMDRVSLWLDTRLGGGPGRGGVTVDPTLLRVRMADFHLDIPRDRVRSVERSHRRVGGTIGVHGSRGDWLVNGSRNGLVELTVDPPCPLPRQLGTLFLKMQVRTLTISLVDPDGFIAVVAPLRDRS